MELIKKKILIVDDNPRNIQIVGNILMKEDVNIAYATEGAKAIELTKTNDFDLILLDIMMPGLDGFSVCEQLRLQKSTMMVPIIFLTAKTDAESIIKGFMAGANDYLTKPFNSAELTARVKTHLDLFTKQKQLDELNQSLEIKVKERTAQLEAANRQLLNLEKAKSEFLSIISHELRSPLNGMIGLTTLLSQTDLTPEQNEYLDSLTQTSRRLARFSEMALLITSLQTKNQTVEIYPVLIKVIIDIVIEEMQEIMIDKEIDLTQSFDNENIQLYVDADLIRKCISILIENAVYHLPAGGKIQLKVFEAEPEKICIQVNDNGLGFDSEVLDTINDFISNGNMITKEGVGLSLAAVKLIMDVHGGKIFVKNNPDNGASICLLFNK
ncbi:MAG: response regulator [Bacteroidetes bacterium]|jgi:two-component system, sensor histidine kinase and response regulator|nr:response regulator [Bacteroidota bacterium]